MLNRRTCNYNIKCYMLMREREREKVGKKKGRKERSKGGRNTRRKEGRRKEEKKMEYLETLERSECRHYNADVMIEKLICL